MQKRKYLFLLLAVLLVRSAYGAFSTPYLPNDTLVLQSTNPNYDFEITFQNLENESTIMNFEVLTGQEWFEEPKFSIDVPAKNYNTKHTAKIMMPDFVVVEGKPTPIEFGQNYLVEYTVSSGDKGGDGVVPVTSQVKKKFNIKVVEPKIEQDNATLATEIPDSDTSKNRTWMWVVVIGVIVVGALWLYFGGKDKTNSDGWRPNEEQWDKKDGQT